MRSGRIVAQREARPAIVVPRPGAARALRKAERSDRVASWLRDPRSAVLIVVLSILGAGGGWKLIQARRIRRAVERLDDADVSREEILEIARFAREGLPGLFHLLESSPRPEARDSAALALSRL